MDDGLYIVPSALRWAMTIDLGLDILYTYGFMSNDRGWVAGAWEALWIYPLDTAVGFWLLEFGSNHALFNHLFIFDSERIYLENHIWDWDI